MFDFLLASANLPFSVALAAMLMIGAVEALGLGLSAAHVDLHADLDAHGADLLGWLGFGRVPVLMLLVVFLTLFGMIGIALQQAAAALIGGPLAPLPASAVAAIAALPAMGVTARGLARILPGDETTAVPRDSLVGKRGAITVGTARRGFPAQARVRDGFGQSHYVMVEPNDDQRALTQGETILLVRREGDTFIAIGEADGLIG